MSQQINLYNAAFIPKQPLLTAQNLALAALVVYGVLAALGTWASVAASRKTAEASLAQAQAKQAQELFDVALKASAARKPSPALQAEIDHTQALLSMRDEVLAELNKGMGADGKAGAGFGDYLTGLARQSRDGLWLSGFTVAADGSGMVLRGRTLDKSLLPDYVRRLNSEPAFSGKSFAGMQMDYREGVPAAESRPGAVPPAPTLGAVSKGPARYLEFQLLAENMPATAEKKP
jgi:type II secretory pathway pseudopilin PulG